MTERDEVVTRLRASGVLPAIRWAYLSAAAQTLNDYSEDAGYDASGSGVPGIRCFVTTWTGFSPAGATPLRRGNTAYLTAHDIETKPEVPHTLVQRADLNRSHGWVIENIRFLLASPPYGEIEQLPWPQKSSTKQQVASQPSPEPLPTLFDEFAPGEIGGLVAASEEPLLSDTYVVAHSLDPVGGHSGLIFGRPRFNEGGGDAWYWYVDLLGEPPAEQGQKVEPPSPSGPPDIVPDAPVRLRQREARSTR